jgi:hypothetical protein
MTNIKRKNWTTSEISLNIHPVNPLQQLAQETGLLKVTSRTDTTLLKLQPYKTTAVNP